MSDSYKTCVEKNFQSFSQACVRQKRHSFSFLPHRALLHIPHHPYIIIVIKPSNHARNIDDTIDDEERD